MHRVRRRLRDEKGETLLELMLAIGMLGIIVVAIASTMVISIVVSGVHRNQASAQAYARDYAEQIEAYIASGTSGSQHYVNCATAGAYGPGVVGYTEVNGFTATASAALTWNGTTWGACNTDPGYQKVTVTVQSPDIGAKRAIESLDVILRNPCRASDGTCP